MAGFNPQPDEGYSEDPLTAQSAAPSTLPLKSQREDAVTTLGTLNSARSGDEFPPWLVQHISSLPLTRKTELAMALLNDLPTTVISQIVENLHPRLYIDFVRCLPPEVCLHILEYLDPLSLINLWEQLYFLEGWKAVPGEVAAAEKEMNGPTSSSIHGVSRRMGSDDDGHAHKKRAISLSPTLDIDRDTVMTDAGASLKQEPIEMDQSETSIFGGPRRPPLRTGISQRMSNLDIPSPVSRSNSKGKGVDKGKGKAKSTAYTDTSRPSFLQTVMRPQLAKSSLWAWDGSSTRFKINWKYLYSMRRKLEVNWERGRYVNFQFPHPAHPEEGHEECVYSLQFNAQYLVSGSRDRTIKVWDMKTRRCLRTLAKHRGSVLCLQFDADPNEDIIVSGSSDSDVIIWRLSTGVPIQTLKNAHRESVLNVRFDSRILVTCSKDKTIKVFNRKPLRYGDLGYQEVDPVGTNIKDYGYNIPMTPDDYPIISAWTMIGCLEGHSAAVNAIQILDREVVSGSGDRHIKVWDWPTQVCTRTIVGHNKGIACVQYDGRRIVSGSSDSEVKVFDRQTGLEVANLRSHTNLVRTVQAGFGDMPYSVEADLEEAKRVDQQYFKALESGMLEERERPRGPGRRPGNAGSRRPEDICAYGAKLPPGGGGGRYGRIISGSYDASIIIWRRDKEGVWKDQHHLRQETAAAAAMQQDRNGAGVPLHPSVQNLVSREALRAIRAAANASPSAAPTAPVTATTTATPATTATTTTTNNAGPSTAPPNNALRSQTSSAPPGTLTGPTLPPISALAMEIAQSEPSTAATFPGFHPAIDTAIEAGPQALAAAIAAQPGILAHRSYVEAAIDRQQNPVLRSQLRQTFASAVVRAQSEQARHRREAIRRQGAVADSAAAGPSVGQPGNIGSSRSQPQPQPQIAAGVLTPAQMAAAAAHQASAQIPQGAHMHQVPSPLPAVVPVAPHRAPSSTAGAGSVVGASSHQIPHQHHQQQHQAQNQLQNQNQAAAAAAATAATAAFDVPDPANAARVFKIQYDARRLICCSQRSVIVGWDFCNGDAELEEASRFYGPVD
ncbi:uncharacterized protein C8A04DRAFT_14438 [Dichotomopilus funicola]|uniref:Uncharacterized protein n=1 Tax=Dichotomopilus funicola TaxID=1934379 RepID=A0AAN6UXS7_9PEZI|nr:hypothetical protein C8A04DRAFT_14438 [Dichotomopilus funicola]